MNSSQMLLGCFCHRPHLTLSDRFKIDKGDFICKGVEETQFYDIVFRIIHNLAREGASEIDSIVFDVFAKKYPSAYKLCSQYHHIDFIDTIKSLSIPDNIELYYNAVRKYSMLRGYKDNGFDISGIYDELQDEAIQKDKLNKYTLEDISRHFESKQIELKQKYVLNNGIIHHQLGDDLDVAFDNFRQGTIMGLGFSNPYLNALTYGYTGLNLVSGDSGSGKSMLAVGNICKSACEYLYDPQVGNYVKNKSFVGNALFINTELIFMTQLQPMFLAYVSNVERSKIRQWDLTEDEIQRVKVAGEIIGKHLFAVDLPDFTITNLEETISYYVDKHNIKVVEFDYVHYNNYVGAEIANQTKVPNREDMVLLEITRTLKNLSLKYNIPILSGTQLNRSSREKKQPDSTWLSGGISQEYKCDNVFVITQVTKEDLCDLEPYSHLYNEDTAPTHCIHAIKARDSKFPRGTRVYTRIDLGTGRDYPLFVTDKNLDPLDVQPIELNYIGE